MSDVIIGLFFLEGLEISIDLYLQNKRLNIFRSLTQDILKRGNHNATLEFKCPKGTEFKFNSGNLKTLPENIRRPSSIPRRSL